MARSFRWNGRKSYGTDTSRGRHDHARRPSSNTAIAGFARGHAPELDIRGTIATGIPNLAAAASTTAGAGDADKVDRIIVYLLYIASAAGQIDPKYDPIAVLTDRAMLLFDRAAATCVVDMFARA